MNPKQTAFEAAVDMLGLAGLARAVGGVTAQAVSKWKGGVPLDRCASIERATAGQVRCEDLRPDVIWQRDDTGRVTGYTVQVDQREVA